MNRKNSYDLLKKKNLNNNKINKYLNQSTINILKNHLLIEHQKQYPFGKNKIRNKNTYLNGNDIKKGKKMKQPLNDNLQGGIGNFLNLKYLQSTDNNILLQRNKNNFNYEFKRKIITKRVLNPIFNNEPEIGVKDIKVKNIDKERHSTTGNFKSLIDKTPLIIPIKGKKRINNSYDIKNNSLDINYDNFIGLEKRGKVKNRRIDIETIQYISHLGKRHFSLPKDNIVF